MDENTLRHRLKLAHDRLQKLASYNGPYGARVHAEQEYSIAYQALVRAGLAPQIRKKYR